MEIILKANAWENLKSDKKSFLWTIKEDYDEKTKEKKIQILIFSIEFYFTPIQSRV